jgi:hypothetical protein
MLSRQSRNGVTILSFNAEVHHERLRILNYGRKKWPEEKNITNLYEMACKDLGIEIKPLSASMANHLPTPEESARAYPDSALIQICPGCGEKSYVPKSICQGCKESENGKYKMKLECYRCNHSEKLEKWMVQWMNEKQIEIPDGMKRNLGIKTVTDDGLK